MTRTQSRDWLKTNVDRLLAQRSDGLSDKVRVRMERIVRTDLNRFLFMQHRDEQVPFPPSAFPSFTLSLLHPFPPSPFPSFTLSLLHPFPLIHDPFNLTANLFLRFTYLPLLSMQFRPPGPA